MCGLETEVYGEIVGGFHFYLQLSRTAFSDPNLSSRARLAGKLTKGFAG